VRSGSSELQSGGSERQYRFRDFMISGAPLTALVLVLLMLLVPLLWPLAGG